MDAYYQYLKKAFQSVLVAAFEDESLTILKDMENKTYYFARLQQIFAEVYSAEREKKIQQLISEVEQLKQPSLSQKQNQAASSSEQEEIQVIQHQERRSSLNNATLLSENEKLANQLQKAKKTHVEEIEMLIKAHQNAYDTLKEKNQHLMNKVSLYVQELEDLKGDASEKDSLICSLHQTMNQNRREISRLEEKVKEQCRLRQLSEQQVRQSGLQIGELKEIRSHLEQKISRLQANQKCAQQKINAFSSQILKFTNQQENNKKQANQVQAESIQGSGVHNMIILSKLTAKQEEVSYYLKKVKDLGTKLEEKQKQLISYKIYAERTLAQSAEKQKRNTNQLQRQLTLLREEYDKINETRDGLNLNQSLKQSKSKVEELSEKLRENETKTAKISYDLKCSNQNLTAQEKQYEKMSRLLEQERKQNKQEINKLQQKIEGLQKLERELQKRVAIMVKKCEENDDWSERRSQYEERINNLKQQVKDLIDQQKKLKACIVKHEQKERARQATIKNFDESLRQKQLESHVQTLNNQLKSSNLLHQEILNEKDKKYQRLQGEKERVEEDLLEKDQKLKEQQRVRQRLEDKIVNIQNELKSDKDKLIELQQRSRTEVISLMEESDKRVKESCQQIERHYTQLLQSASNSKGQSASQIQKLVNQYKESTQKLEIEVRDEKKKNHSWQRKINELTAIKNSLTDRNKIYENKLVQAMAKMDEVTEKLSDEKECRVKVIRYYEEKFSQFKSSFKEFKFEMCSQFLEAIQSVKKDWVQIKKSVEEMRMRYSKQIVNKQDHAADNLEDIVRGCLKNKLENLKGEGENKVQQSRRQYEDMRNKYENQIKNIKMEMMTALAQKEYQIQGIQQQQTQILKKNRQYENLLEKANKNLQISESNEESLKQVISKMEAKVNNAERQQSCKEKQTALLERAVEELTHRLETVQENHRSQLKQMRQRYREDNERMFGKYQRQFNKMINLNKKTTSLCSIGNTTKTIQVPTKGGKEQSKIDKLQREIQQQKRLLQGLERRSRK